MTAVALRVSGDGKAILKHFDQSLFVTGVLTSPNYPNDYPNNVERTDIIEVDEGLVVALKFTAFNVDYWSTRCNDHLTIRDGDGTTLMEKRCGSSPPASTIVSTSNIVDLYFKTDSSGTYSGWSVSWIAVTQGECQDICLSEQGYVVLLQNSFSSAK